MKNSGSMQSPETPDPAELPPGFLRPTRLRFDFLPGDSDSLALSPKDSDPDISPICGWFVLNHLEDSISVFETDGSSLGSIANDGRMRPDPGTSSIEPPMIENVPLRRLVSHILQQGPSCGERFRSRCASALEAIKPGSSARQEELALLLERPMAIVRARIGFEHAGLPPDEHVWSAYDSDEASPTGPAEPADHDSRQVTIPVRLGASQEGNGGLVGFWVEDGDGLGDGVFHFAAGADEDGSPAQSGKPDDGIQSVPERSSNICQALPDADIMVTMLLDPHGEVQATSGMTPAASIALSAGHFVDPLRAMAVRFRSHPLLTDPGKTNMPLPEDQGGDWSWTERSGDEADQQQTSGMAARIKGWLDLHKRDR